ncbi:cytosolic thiouridylase subunit 2 isoform X2 [Rhynchophorus ferrugineus]|uniref:cytosolic thiouridylase subunit 2 isoform X2 n=1 Tax=Rhynchophorus ferrugineus TaxID=354439 RepID=UPI003FCCF8C8
MCSVGDDFDNNDEESQNHMPQLVKLSSDLKCNKCRETTPVVLLRGKDAYCKNCFLIGCNHKFKALLGKSKLIRPNDKVMISYEIGHPSSALLHLIRSGLDLNTPKKLRFTPVFVYLEDQYHLTVNERQTAINKIIKETNSYNFDINIVSFCDWVLTKEINLFQNTTFNIGDNDGDRLISYIKEKTPKTNKNEIFNILRRNALCHIAKKLDCKFIFTPEISIDIASNLLKNIALGKGAHVSVDTGFCDDRDDSISILRPLRMFDMKELAFYNVLHSLDPVTVRQPIVNNYSSVQELMKKFVTDLQEGYPATINTIIKIGDKLVIDKTTLRKCKLCEAVIPEPTGDLNSEESTKFSKLVSNRLPDHNLTAQTRYAEAYEEFSAKQDVPSDYCYSCSKISEYILSDDDVE